MTIDLNYRGCELKITFSIQPNEPENGIREHIDDISEITMNGFAMYELLVPQFDEIETAIWKALENEG